MDESFPKPSSFTPETGASLKLRILATLRFFALQDIPLTLFELHKYLLQDPEVSKKYLNADWEIQDYHGDSSSSTNPAQPQSSQPVSLGQIQNCLERDCADTVSSFRGYYYLPNYDPDWVTKRLHNYRFGLRRERLIEKYKTGLCHLPFIRGVGLVGSQAFGQYKPGSDIDLLIITEPGFLWLARFFITGYFQFFGVRRHGRHVANRFCLNHYLTGPKVLQQDRNIYTASEYLKLRPLYPSSALDRFRSVNRGWIGLLFPNIVSLAALNDKPSFTQWNLEKLLRNGFGRWLERVSGRLQLRQIRLGQFVVVEPDELSFHPDNRKQQLFGAFFKDQQ